MNLRIPHTERHDNLDRWLLTYADMITLLTAFFLMLYSMSVMSKGKFTQLATSVRSGFGSAASSGNNILNGGGAHATQIGILPDIPYQQYQEAMGNLRRYVEQNRLSGQVSTHTDERGTVISILSDSMLFVRGRAELSPESGEVLARVAQILRPLPNNIQIEGHTCDLPISTAQFPSNWELSTARAGTVLRYFTEQAGLPRKQFRAAGYADTRPLAPNTSEENRARNRRVDIVILKSEEQQEADLLRRQEIRRITVPSNADRAPSATTTPESKTPP